MWGSRLRARSASDIFDPSTFFCSSNQTQDGWSSNGPTLHLLSFSVCLPSTLHSRTATTICRLRDDGTSSSSFFFFFMGAVEYFISWQSFRVRLHILFFFLSELRKCARTCWRSGRGNGEQRTGGGKKEKLGTKEMQRKMKRRNKKTKRKVLPVPQLQLHHPPSLLSRPPGRPLRLLRSHSLLRRLTVLVLPDRMICHFITNW